MTSKSDDQTRVQVIETINAIPSVKTGDCEVYVNAGVVTLCGRVNSYQAVSDIENRVRKISGIHGIQTYIQSDIGMDHEQRGEVRDRRCARSDRRFSKPDGGSLELFDK